MAAAAAAAAAEEEAMALAGYASWRTLPFILAAAAWLSAPAFGGQLVRLTQIHTLKPRDRERERE